MEIILNGDITEQEVELAKKYLKEKYLKADISRIEITANGEFLDINFWENVKPFERIRRITGYLTSTVDKWNNAKQAEEKDRVKHNI